MGFWKDITGQTAAENAASAMNDASNKSIGILQDQYASSQEMLTPYMQVGTNALEQQQALSGALGPEAQQAAYDAIQNSSGFQSQLAQGETSLLQNAAATGGVRGGNTAGALAQYSPALLNNAIDQQYSQLGGLSSLGANAANALSTTGMNMASGVANQYSDIGNTNAQTALSSYSNSKNFLGDLAGFGLNLAGLF